LQESLPKALSRQALKGLQDCEHMLTQECLNKEKRLRSQMLLALILVHVHFKGDAMVDVLTNK
jgi:hypothetical protein